MTKQEVYDNRNTIGRCPCCNGNIKDRKIAIFKGLIDALYRVYCWCGKNRKHEFETKEVKHLFGKTEYARFGDLVRFGGLLYKPKVDGKSTKAIYGLNMERAKEFFSRKRDIPIQITIEQFTGTIISEVRGYVDEFPELYKLLKSDGMYDHEKDVATLWDNDF